MRKTPVFSSYLWKDQLTRFPGQGDALEVQAKVCGECGQLVLTYRESTRCIVCGGLLKPAKKHFKKD